MHVWIFAFLWNTVTWAGENTLELFLAEGQLEKGSYRMASARFQDVLEKRPGSGRAKLGLARAYAGIGQCDDALVLLTELRGRPVWGADGANAEGACLLRRGRVSEAVAAFEEASWFSPRKAQAWFNLALLAVDLDDLDGFERAVEALATCDGGDVLEVAARATRALEWGEPSFDSWLGMLRGLSGGGPHLHGLDGRAWLDLDDPQAAGASFHDAIRLDMDNVQLARWRSESLRRAGDLAGARAAVDRPMLRRAGAGPLAQALEVRLLVDEGEIDEAERVLATLDLTDPEAMASAWYVAHARGDAVRKSDLVVAWSQRVRAAGRSLEQLIPIHQREAP